MDGASYGEKSKRSADGDLALPTAAVELKARFGSSVIDQFVQAHSPADVFRELVQNEFDAQGAEITIRFGERMLSVSGTGRPVNSKGWKRLQVIMGTGTALGDGARDNIEAKQSGIGSKNFGIRSLFLFGDRINVRSDGKFAVIDMAEFGAGIGPDPDTKGRKGILIQVPYRTSATRTLSAFTVEREHAAMDQIEHALLPTLVKLANPGKGPGINALTIVSDRTGRELRWRQTARTLTSKVSGVTVTLRKGRLQLVDAMGRKSSRTDDQLEFSTLVEIPGEYAGVDFPAYYRSGRRIRIGVSVQMKGRRPDLSHQGRLYYPLEAGLAFTGMALSASAPFQLDPERTRLIPGDWNAWLLEKCAELVVGVVGKDWFPRFGASAYAVLIANGQGGSDSLQTLVQALLAVSPCWPSRENAHLVKADQLHIPAAPALEGILADSQLLDRELAENALLQSLAKASGANTFSVNSLARLRCGGIASGSLATKLQPKESNFHFTHGVADLNIQVSTATALTELNKHLSGPNRQDIRDTATTLAADGTLKAAKALTIVPADMHATCPVPASDRLHPDLNSCTAVSSFCEIFNISNWMIKAAERARVGDITEDEHQTLYRYVMAPETKFTSEAVAVLRGAPVLKDDQGRWAAPDDLAVLPPRDATVLGIVRRPPERAAVRRPDLLKRLSIRRKVAAVDLLAAAKGMSGRPDLAVAFEDVLRRHADLVGKREREALEDVPFLRTRGGNLAAPACLHLPTPLNDACLDDPDLLVTDGNMALFRQLGCHEVPSSNVLVEVIGRARDAGRIFPRPDLLYPALVKALKDEGRPTAVHNDEPILLVEGEYVAPKDCLVSPRAPACLKGAIPIHRNGGAIGEAYVALGASASPTDHHWTTFFISLGKSLGGQANRPLRRDAREALRGAYRILGRTHFSFVTLGPQTKFLLADRGTLHSLAELEAGDFLENDYSELATALTDAGAPVAFADREEDSRILFRRLGIKLLSRVCGEPRIVVGKSAQPPAWHRGHNIELLEQIHRDDVGDAITELAYARQSPDFHPTRSGELKRRLKAITSIQFVDRVERQYGFRKNVAVDADATLDGNRFVLRPPRYKMELDHLLASEIAVLAGAATVADTRALASTIAQLLGIKAKAEMLSFLRLQGIQPKLLGSRKEDDELDPGEQEEDTSGILADLMKTVNVSPPSPTTPPAPVLTSAQHAPPPAPTPPPPPAPTPLLPIGSVTLTVVEPSVSPPPMPSRRGRGGGGRQLTSWVPPTTAEIDRDRLVGALAEELVYREELERVRALGHERPEELVIWVSKANPGADHDIRSVGMDGGPIWIEVKGTTGTEGRFDWSIAEFEKALREGERYHLWRVYRVGSENAVAKIFRNPAALLKKSLLHIEIGTIRACVQSV